MEALSRILGSQTFAKSARLSAFLRYVCVTTLEGRDKILCEQHIGSAVFGRPDHYNPADDTIVRTTARLLRQRLTQYYEDEGRRDPIRITIPRGAYVPVFVAATPEETRPSESVAASAVAMPAVALAEVIETIRADKVAQTHVSGDAAPLMPPPPPPPLPSPSMSPMPAMPSPQPRRWRLSRTTTLSLAAVLALLFILAAWLVSRSGAPAVTPASRFWATMLPADRDTLLVVADNGLVMYQGDTHRQVGLTDYLANRPGTADTPAAAQSLAQYGARRYTAMSSVTLAVELGKLATAAPQRLHARFARDVQLADLKHGNTILVGVEQSNPWWELFQNQFNFHIDWDHLSGDFAIRNDRPAAGEQASYPFSWRDPNKRGYALVGFMRNLSNDGHTLLIGGTTSAGTDAAIEFLMNPAFMAPLMKKTMRPDGSVSEFEVLLQCVLQANGSTDIQVLGLRIKRP